MKPYLLHSRSTVKGLYLTQIYDAGFPKSFFVVTIHLSVSRGADRVRFLSSTCYRGYTCIFTPVSRQTTQPDKDKSTCRYRGKDDLSPLCSSKTEFHPRNFRMKVTLSRITCTKWPTSSLLSVPSELSSIWVCPCTSLLSCFKSKGKMQDSGETFGDFP